VADCAPLIHRLLRRAVELDSACVIELLSPKREGGMAHWRIAVVPLAALLLLCRLPCSFAANCSASYTINLTVDLSPELTNNKTDLLIELRQGSSPFRTCVLTPILLVLATEMR
jgi:hypothetical protein